MADCELMSTCPYFNGDFQEGPELTERLKKEYCRGDYTLCGRYIAYKALEGERKRENPEFAAQIN